MSRLPLPPRLKLKRPSMTGPVAPRANVGQLVSTRQIVKKEKNGGETTLSENTDINSLEADSVAHTGVAGINLGLTIPGEKGSFMTARIDVFGYVPAIPTDEGMRAAFNRISNLCQERLEVEADEAREALGV